MQTEITTIYVVYDDFLKAMNHRGDAQAGMTTTEMMTTALVSARFFKNCLEHARVFLKEASYIQLHVEHAFGEPPKSTPARSARTTVVGVVRGVGASASAGVGKTKCGKGSKIMVVADGTDAPVAIHVSSASPHESQLVESTLAARFVASEPERLIGDKAYDSDELDATLTARGIQMIAPHRGSHVRVKTQDGRVLRRYKRRWKIERLNSWLLNHRRIVVRYERRLANYVGFVHLACVRILLRRCF